MKPKICISCKESKDSSEFGKDKNKKDGKCIYCLICRRQKELRWRQTPKGKKRPSSDYLKNCVLKRLYGINLHRYQEILNTQNGVCVICGNPPEKLRLSVDHCHDTGSVRGLLFYRCNTGLGNFQDSLSLLKSAVSYLENTKDLRQ